MCVIVIMVKFYSLQDSGCCTLCFLSNKLHFFGLINYTRENGIFSALIQRIHSLNSSLDKSGIIVRELNCAVQGWCMAVLEALYCLLIGQRLVFVFYNSLQTPALAECIQLNKSLTRLVETCWFSGGLTIIPSTSCLKQTPQNAMCEMRNPVSLPVNWVMYEKNNNKGINTTVEILLSTFVTPQQNVILMRAYTLNIFKVVNLI